MTVTKLLPFVLSWFFTAMFLLRGAKPGQTVALSASIAGFAAGMLAVAFGFPSPGIQPAVLVKSIVGAGFVVLWIALLAGLYLGRESGSGSLLKERFSGSMTTMIIPFYSGVVIGAAATCSLAVSEIIPMALVFISSAALAAAAMMVERKLHSSIGTSGQTLLTVMVAFQLFLTSSSPQLDLFSSLSMKVMKFIHDLLHQAFETMLLPDHQFFKSSVWDYIGLLFSNQVGLWGGALIWLLPAILAGVVVLREPQPSVAHIRQGVLRRSALATFITERRWRLLAPAFAFMVLAAAIYQSRFPDVEYWDPKPIVVTAQPSREIIIPRKGDVQLEDGKLHKFLLRKNEQDVRFFFLKLPSGALVAVLDACAICKPEGYGQTEGSVICYYCKTLIPIETVGKPGGCNPVPISFESREDAVVINSALLYMKWNEAVQGAKIRRDGR